jgi:aromatic-L-amino-acid/L-tryptophan decarboxylase
MNTSDFRTHGHAVIDWVADFRDSLATRPVMAQVKPGDVRARIPVSPPDTPEPFEHILADLDTVIAPGLSHFQHPRFFGYFPANSMLASVLGDYLSTGLGALGLSWQSAPALAELEERMTEWMRQLLGLADAWQGVIQDTASTGTLLGLLLARERSTAFGMAHGGLQSAPAPLVVYVTQYSHSSVDKAALLAGFGRDNVRVVAHDAHFAFEPAALAAAIEADRAAGRIPCAIVGTTGSTTTTALDPIAALAALAKQHGLWLHVDAALAGSAMILPECRWMWDGIDGADSIALNPHKWLGAAFDCSLFYVRDAQHLIRVMGTNPSYLQSAADGSVKNYRDWGIPLGRRFRALKLWTLLRAEGADALRARLRRDIANAQWLADQVRTTPDWRVLAPTPLQTVCVRHEPPGLSGDALDRHTLAWVDRVNQSGLAYLTPATLDGRWMCRVSVGAYPTEREHVEQLWEGMREAVNP